MGELKIREISGMASSPFFIAENQASLWASAVAPTTNIEKTQPSEPGITSLDYYTPYDRTFLQSFWSKEEADLFDDYTKMYRVNPFAHFIVEAVLTTILGEGFHLEGDEAGVREVDTFFFENRFNDRLRVVARHMLLYGNGYFDMKLLKDEAMPKGYKITGLDYINGATIRFQGKGGYQSTATSDVEAYQYIRNQKASSPLDMKKLLHFKMWDTGDSYYGMSLIRPNYMFLLALFDIIGDIPMAVKRVAYVPLVVKLNLSGIEETNRTTYIARFRKMVHALSSAGSNFVIDQRHEIMYPENSGRALNMPLNDLLRPIFSVVLMNAGLSTALLNTTANNAEAEIGSQDEMSNRQIRYMRRQVEDIINQYLIPLITKGDVKFVLNRSPAEAQFEGRMFVDLWSTGALSRETLLDKLDITDEGKTFIERTTPLGGGPSNP